jgi:protein ImuB
MLWVALHFPQFRRQALSRGHAPPEPEQEALAAVAAWACQFTPRVSLEPPRALLMEVEGSLRYFGGRWKFLARLREGLMHLGFKARIAEAPAARAALWMARGDGGRLEALPVAVTGFPSESLELLANLGIGTIGALMRLPRDGFTRRFGQELLDEIDRARGKAPEPREFFIPPAHFSMRLELPAPVLQAESALFAARRLLEQMQGFLAARQAGVRSFSLDLLHHDTPATRIRVGLATPGRDKEHFARLLRERLARLKLRAAVEAIGLEAGDLEIFPEENGGFFKDPRTGSEEWLRLVERLQSRLGGPAVHGLGIREDHRPEFSFRRVEPGMESMNPAGRQSAVPGPRPLWLLEVPRRLAEGEFALLAGPERIESGWWDGAEARRDYFIARTGEASMAWIYRERGAEPGGHWFLHGFFA